MDVERNAVARGSRLLMVSLTLLGVVVVAAGVFIAKGTDDSFGLFFATNEVGISPALAAQGGLLKRLALLVLLPLSGLAADLLGRRGWAMSGAGILGLGFIAKAQAHAMPLYFVGEMITALGLAMVLPSLVALAMEAMKADRLLSSAAGAVLLIEALSMYVVALLPARIAQEAGWRWALGAMGGVALLGAVVGGALLLAPRLMARRPAPAETPAGGPGGWLWPLVILGCLGVTLLFAAMNSVIHTLIFYFVKSILQADVTAVSGVFAVSGVATAGALLLASPLADLLERFAAGRGRGSWARPAVVVLGLAVICLGAVLLRVADSLPGTTLALATLGMGYGLTMPSLIAMLVASIKPRWWASVAGLHQAAGTLGTGLGGASVAVLLARVGYVPNMEQSAETIAGLRHILSIAGGVGVAALILGIAAAALYLLSSRSQNK